MSSAGGRFELTIPFRAYLFSRPACSTTPAPPPPFSQEIVADFFIFSKKNRTRENAAYENLLRTKIAFARANSKAQNARFAMVSSATMYLPSCGSRWPAKTSPEKYQTKYKKD